MVRSTCGTKQETAGRLVLQPRCIIDDPGQRRVLVISCQDFAARVWPVRREGNIMMLDPGTPLEWVVATDIDEWAVVPWQPEIAFNSDVSQALYGCVTFHQIRPAVSALAWAVAHHHLQKSQLLRFARCRAAAGAKELLEGLLKDHPDKAFHMDICKNGKTARAIPTTMMDVTTACLAELDPDNLRFCQA